MVIHVVVGDSLRRSPESRSDILLIFCTHHCLQIVDSPRMLIVKRYIGKPVLALELPTIEIALRPNPGRTELVVLVGSITVCSEGRNTQRICHIIVQLQMSIEVHVLRIITLLEQGTGRIHLRCSPILHPTAVQLIIRISRIHGIGRIEKHLTVEDIIVLERRTEHAEISRQFIAKRLLGDINLSHQITIALAPNNRVMVDIAKRSAVVALRSATAEGQIMVLNISGSGNRLAEIGIISLIVILQPILLCSSNVFGGIEHLHTFVHRLYTIVSLVRNLKSLTRTLLGLYLDNARSTTGTIECRFAGILQYCKALYVGGIDCSKRRHIRSNTINNHQRIIAAHDRSCTANPDGVQHSNTVKTIGSDVNTCRLSAQGIQGIIEHTLLQKFRLHYTHRT